MNIYVRQPGIHRTETDLKKAFEAYGQVATATSFKDQYSDRSKGSGLSKCRTRLKPRLPYALHGTDLNGRTITVNEARPKADRNRRRRTAILTTVKHFGPSNLQAERPKLFLQGSLPELYGPCAFEAVATTVGMDKAPRPSSTECTPPPGFLLAEKVSSCPLSRHLL